MSDLMLALIDPWDIIWGVGGFVLGCIFGPAVLVWVKKKRGG
jgi:hypothetical protein